MKGYTCEVFTRSEDALEALEQTSPEVLLTDIVMPGTIDGVGLAGEVRSRFPHLPVILTTGYSDATQAVPHDLRILRKPFDADALRNVIQDMMEASLASPN